MNRFDSYWNASKRMKKFSVPGVVLLNKTGILAFPRPLSPVFLSIKVYPLKSMPVCFSGELLIRRKGEIPLWSCAIQPCRFPLVKHKSSLNLSQNDAVLSGSLTVCGVELKKKRKKSLTKKCERGTSPWRNRLLDSFKLNIQWNPLLNNRRGVLG